MTYPTPLQLLVAKRQGKQITIGMPDGRQILLTEFLRSWKRLLKMPPQEDVKGWNWYCVTAREILTDIRHGIHDRINRHLPWKIGELDRMRVRRKLAKLNRKGLLPCECRWCGSSLSTYQRHENRFCDNDCRRSYNT